MSLTQEQIKKIAENLSKIPANDWKLGTDMNNIIEYFELLSEVDTTWVEPTYNVTEKESILREDIEIPKIAGPNELLACSKQKVVWNQIAIPNIMK